MFKAIFVTAPRAIGRFAADFWSGYTPFGQFMLTLAAIAIVVDAVICYNYGITNTFWHGVGFALLAIVLAILPDAAAQEWEKSAKGSAIAIAVGCCFLAPVAYQSHLGYSASVRVGDINLTQAKLEVKDNDREAIERARSDKKLAEAAIARLKWLPVDVTAEGAAAAIANMEGDRIFTRSRQCAQVTIKESREFCDRLTELRKQKAAVEDLSRERKRLDDANAWLNKATEKIASADNTQSAVVNQTKVASQLLNLIRGKSSEETLDPDRYTQTFVNTGIAGANSLAFMIMAPLCWFVAGRNRRKEDEHEPAIAHQETVATPANDDGKLFPTVNLTVQEAKGSDWLKELIARPEMQQLMNGKAA